MQNCHFFTSETKADGNNMMISDAKAVTKRCKAGIIFTS